MSRIESCLRQIVDADETRFRHPGEALTAARAACEQAAAVPHDPHDSHAWFLLQAEAWSVVASAYRACGDMAKAESCLNLALEFLDRIPEGGVEEKVWARLAQRASYLRCSQRRYEEALQLNDDVLRIYDALERSDLLAGARVDRALIVGRRGDIEEAIRILSRCLEKLNGESQPKPYLAAIHNMTYYQLQAARTTQEEKEALKWLSLAYRRHEQEQAPFGLAQLQAMAGATAVRFGRRRQGTKALWQAYHRFGEMDALPDQVFALLHLADSAVAAGDDDEILRIAGLFFPLLGRIALPDVTRALLMRFLNAARSRSVTRDLVSQMTEKLKETIG